MNNRYIFRGKRKYNGEWVEGDLIQWKNGNMQICLGVGLNKEQKTLVDIIPETVGQCTGLKDKNGKLIFEGDILLFINDDGEKTPYKVFWSEEYAGYIIVTNDRAVDTMDCWDKYRKNFEVIGNIHDKPELLEVER